MNEASLRIWRIDNLSSNNIYDIASLAGVSPATVSRVLNGNKNVKEATKKKVLAIIEQEGYKPNTLARNLSKKDSNTIAFVVPDIDNNFFIKLLQGITSIAIDLGLNVSMYDTNEDVEREQQVLSSLSAEMIKGIIIIPVYQESIESKEKLENFEKNGVPIVLIDRDLIGSGFDGVFSDDINGTEEAIECFIDAGHKSIAIITGPLTSRPGRERYEGYKKALEKNNIPFRSDYVVNGGFRVQESYQAMQTLMKVKPKPTAIFASNNLTTLGCLKYMKENGMKLGKDISIISFDDIPELTYTDISLTAVTRPVYELGCDAMNLLSIRFNESLMPERARNIIRRHTVRTEIIKRGSEKLISLPKKTSTK